MKEEPACQKFAKVPVSPCEIEASDSHDDSCGYVEGDDHVGEILAPGCSTFPPDQGERCGVARLHSHPLSHVLGGLRLSVTTAVHAPSKLAYDINSSMFQREYSVFLGRP
jgi:hypothetical protein